MLDKFMSDSLSVSQTNPISKKVNLMPQAFVAN